MKIGIITFVEANNYGATLQAYALQEVLGKLGHEPFFPSIAMHSDFGQGLKRFLGRSMRMTINKWYEIFRFLIFEQFRRKYINRTASRRMPAQTFLDAPCIAPVYITGSDQVWNSYFASPYSAERSVFWLNFLNDRIKRIAYAASFGGDCVNENDHHEYKEYIARFHAISVREESAIHIVKSLGREAKWVCDPTMLLSVKDYAAITGAKKSKKVTARAQYIYEYAIDLPCQYSLAHVRSIVADSKHWRAYSTFQPEFPKYLSISTWDSPSKWLQRIAGSRLVITNSFHCIALSIVFSTPFIVVPLAGNIRSRNVRIQSLLERLSLQDRILDSCTKKDILDRVDREIDWTSVHQILNDWREESLSFLNSALQTAWNSDNVLQ